MVQENWWKERVVEAVNTLCGADLGEGNAFAD